MKLNEKESACTVFSNYCTAACITCIVNFLALLVNEILDRFTIKNLHKKCINQCLLSGGGGKGKRFTHSIGLSE